MTSTAPYPKINIYFGEKAIHIEKNPDKILNNDVALRKAFLILNGQAEALYVERKTILDRNTLLEAQVKTLTAELTKEKLERVAEQTTLKTELENKDNNIAHWQGMLAKKEKFQNEFMNFLGKNIKGGKIDKIPLLQDLLVKTKKVDGSYESYWTLTDLVEEVNVLRKGMTGIFAKLGVSNVAEIDHALLYVSDDLTSDLKHVMTLKDLAKSRQDFRNFAKTVSTKIGKDTFKTMLAQIDLYLVLQARYDTLSIAINTVMAQLNILDKRIKPRNIKVVQTGTGLGGGLKRKSIKTEVQNQFILINGVIDVGLGRNWEDESII